MRAARPLPRGDGLTPSPHYPRVHFFPTLPTQCLTGSPRTTPPVKKGSTGCYPVEQNGRETGRKQGPAEREGMGERTRQGKRVGGGSGEDRELAWTWGSGQATGEQVRVGICPILFRTGC